MTRSIPFMSPRRNRAAALAVAFVSMVYILTLCLIETRGFWVPDNANKFLQVQSIIAGRYRNFSIPWPGIPVDPAFEFNPMPHLFSHVVNGRLYSPWSIPFALISAVFYQAFGWHGLFLFPLAASIALLVAVAKTATLIDSRHSVAAMAVCLAGLCTPLWFYTVTFWELSAAAGFGMWGVYFCLRYLRDGVMRNLAAGVFLAGVSVWFRDEQYLLCLLLAAGSVLSRPVHRIRASLTAAMALGAALTPLWFIQKWALGSLLGHRLHASLFMKFGVNQYFLSRPFAFYALLAAAGSGVWLSLALTSLQLVVFAWQPRLSGKAYNLALPLLAVAAMIATGYVMAGLGWALKPGDWMYNSNSLFTVVPILIIALVRKREAGAQGDGAILGDRIRRFCLVYALVYAWLTPSDRIQGIHWGSRMLLIIYPLLAVLAAAAVDDWLPRGGSWTDWKKWTVTAAAAASLACQIYSIVILDRKQSLSVQVNSALAKRPEKVVVTDIWWVPQELYAGFFSKAIFYAPTPWRRRELLSRLKEIGVTEYLAVTEQRQPAPATSVFSVEDTSLGIFNFYFYRALIL